MSVITIKELSKRYFIGNAVRHSDTFREMIMNKLSDSFRRFRDVEGGKHNVKEFWALRDISCEVKSGEVIGIIGKNGAGKSTLLKIISRITAPTSGCVEIRGRVSSLLEVGTGFHPELTGRENIFLNGAILGMTRSEIRDKFDEIVAFSEVEKFLDTPVKRYSSGMYVRLAFSVAAHIEPDVLIVDEVLAVGDTEFQRKCLGKMEGISEQGRTVIVVSHNMGTIQSLCDRVILLDGGRISMEGDPSSVVKSYLAATQSGDDRSFGVGYSINRDLLADSEKSGMHITGCELINPRGTDIGPRTGDPLVIRIHYSTNRQWQAPAFVVSIKDSMDYELVRLSTLPISGYRLEELFPSGCIQLTIEELPLVAGIYYLDIGFARVRVEHIVNLENVIRMEVAESDVYESGCIMDSARGSIVVNHKWDHSSE